MLPVLFSIGPLSISSFGLFLAVGFLYGTFLVWRLARAFDLNEEKILDLTLLSFFGGLIGSRILFIILNLSFFGLDPLRWVLLTKYPGLLFAGGIIGGVLSLYFFNKRLKLDFWQVADFAATGLLGGLIFGDLGCFLGGCAIGIKSNAFFAMPVIGVLDKRFPIQALEATAFALVLWRIWPAATHFHFNGKIVSLGLILIGFFRFLLEFFREKQYGNLGYVFYLILFVFGIFIFYLKSKRSFINDLKKAPLNLVRIITEPRARAEILKELKKNWYNQRVGLNWKLKGWKTILRRANVRPTPKSF